MLHAASARASLHKRRFSVGAAALIAALGCTAHAQATLTPPSPQDFGSVVSGQTSAPIIFTFTNNSAAMENVSSVTSSNVNEFPQQGGPGTGCPNNVAAHSTCTISVTFTPSATGLQGSTLTVTSNDAAFPVLTESLSGTGVAATTTATLLPASWTFPSTIDGNTSASKQFTLTNTGNTAIGNIQIGATGDYSVTPITCLASPATLAPSASCTIDVAFSPTPPGGGTRTGTLTVSSTSSSNPLTASLTGTAVSNLTGLTLSTNALSMGNYEISAGSSSPMPVVLTNNDPTTITFAAPVGANGVAFPVTGNFSQTNTCSQTIASNASCIMSVFFTPTVTGTRTGTITVNSTSSTGTQALGLSGIGTDYTLTTTTPSVTVVQGSTATYAIAFAPIDGYSNTITLGCSGLAVPGTSCAGNATVTLGPGKTVSFHVTTTPKNYNGVIANGLAPNALGTHATWIMGLCGLLLLLLAGRTRRLARTAGLLALLLAMLWPTGGCSGKQPVPDPDATPPGTYTFSLTAADPIQQPKTLALTLVVTGQ
jgi:hypothetical protein